MKDQWEDAENQSTSLSKEKQTVKNEGEGMGYRKHPMKLDIKMNLTTCVKSTRNDSLDSLL